MQSAKGVILEVLPYLTNAHALESTGTPLAAWSPTPGSGNSPSEDRIQLLASGRDLAYSLPIVTELNGCDETGCGRLVRDVWSACF